MGIGSARGDDRSVAAAEMAISSPLLEASIDGAHGVLLSISGGSDLGLFEINEAAQLVSNAAAPDANIIFGAVIDDALGDEVRVTVIAAGFDDVRPQNAPGPQAEPKRMPSGRPAVATPPVAPPRQVAPPASAPPAPPRVTAVPVPPTLPAPTPHRDSAPAQPAHGAADDPAEPAQPAEAKPAKPEEAKADEPETEAAGPAKPADARPEGATPPRSASGEAVPRPKVPRPASEPTAASRSGDSVRRRPVVFDEDDDLDIPDFLK
jgi:cell division protein FtsZ